MKKTKYNLNKTLLYPLLLFTLFFPYLHASQGTLYVQTKGIHLIAESTGDESFQKAGDGNHFFKVVGDHEWAVKVMRINGRGEAIDHEVYYTSASTFQNATSAMSLGQLIAGLHLTADSATSPPRQQHCPNCEKEQAIRQPLPSAKPKRKPKKSGPVVAGAIPPAKFAVSDNAFKMIQQFEGCIRCGYKDVSQFSIGFGTRLRGNWSLSRDEERVANNQCLAKVKMKGCTAKKKRGFPRLRRGCLCSGGADTKKAAKNMRAHFNETGIIRFIKREIKVPLKQHQIDALASWYYNFGNRAYDPSDPDSPSFSHYLNQGNYAEGAKRMTWWRMAEGKKSGGLMVRRAKEHYLFMNGGSLKDIPFKTNKQALDYWERVSGKQR